MVLRNIPRTCLSETVTFRPYRLGTSRVSPTGSERKHVTTRTEVNERTNELCLRFQGVSPCSPSNVRVSSSAIEPGTFTHHTYSRCSSRNVGVFLLSRRGFSVSGCSTRRSDGSLTPASPPRRHIGRITVELLITDRPVYPAQQQ